MFLVEYGYHTFQLTRIPYLPHSAARDLLIASTPAFAEALGQTNPEPCIVYGVVIARNTAPFPAWMSLFPMSRVTFADPFRTISMIVFQALLDKRSVGDTKFPAALLITILGSPNWFSHWSTACLTEAGSLTSSWIGTTLLPEVAEISSAVFWRTRKHVY